jgi:hypothetical protein
MRQCRTNHCFYCDEKLDFSDTGGGVKSEKRKVKNEKEEILLPLSIKTVFRFIFLFFSKN